MCWRRRGRPAAIGAAPPPERARPRSRRRGTPVGRSACAASSPSASGAARWTARSAPARSPSLACGLASFAGRAIGACRPGALGRSAQPGSTAAATGRHGGSVRGARPSCCWPATGWRSSCATGVAIRAAAVVRSDRRVGGGRRGELDGSSAPSSRSRRSTRRSLELQGRRVGRRARPAAHRPGASRDLVGAAPVVGHRGGALSIQQALSALDRLEVRGRDSAGLHVLVRGHGLDLADPPWPGSSPPARADPLFTLPGRADARRRPQLRLQGGRRDRRAR